MKPLLGLLGLGVAAILIQSILASYLSARFCPDLGLLVVIAVALGWRGSFGGMIVASLLGYLTDVLSGSLLGLHALLRVVAFLATRLPSRHLSLRSGLPLACFVAVVTVGNALAIGALTGFVSGAVLDPRSLAWDLLPQAVVNAVAAGFVLRAAEWVVGVMGDDDAGRRILRFETRSFSP